MNKNESLTGVVERITFKSEENGYTIARLQVIGQSELITITTAITRAKQLADMRSVGVASVIGQEKPINIAVKQVKDQLGYTKLKQRLI